VQPRTIGELPGHESEPDAGLPVDRPLHFSLAPETNSALVTCTATNSGHCSAWTLNPVTQPNGSVQNVARLQQATNGTKFLNLGDFFVSFLFNITDP